MVELKTAAEIDAMADACAVVAEVIAIEPMLIADGSENYIHDSDAWTLPTSARNLQPR